eukprot:6196414-Pleurochrysis_carterae.AAC.4
MSGPNVERPITLAVCEGREGGRTSSHLGARECVWAEERPRECASARGEGGARAEHGAKNCTYHTGRSGDSKARRVATIEK